MFRYERIIAALMALFFFLQAFSPHCATFTRTDASQPARPDGSTDVRGARLGIAWLHLVLTGDTITPVQADPTITAQRASEDDGEFLIVKRKRAIIRSKQSFKPSLIAWWCSPQVIEPASTVLFSFASAVNVELTATDDYSPLTSGLSPPVILS